ncbi:MAG: response regulator transcription factor [candidate division WOR-3 bacterium]
MVIAVVEDDKEIRDLVALHLERSNFLVLKFAFASELMKYLSNKKLPDLIILDIMLPDYDGIELLKLLKSKDDYKNIPVIMLTARSDEADRVLGLELGADDYVVKPFSPRELVSRVKAILRRMERTETHIIKLGDKLVIDIEKGRVYIEGEELKLTPSEYDILNILSSKPGRIFSREEILSEIGKSEEDVSERVIDVHITNLRKKLKKAGVTIKNIRGRGYTLEFSPND